MFADTASRTAMHGNGGIMSLRIYNIFRANLSSTHELMPKTPEIGRSMAPHKGLSGRPRKPITVGLLDTS